MARPIEQIRADMAKLQQELDDAEAETRKAEEVRKGLGIVAKVALLKALFIDIKAGYPDALPTAWLETPQQGLPREALIGRRFGLSETQVHDAREKARKVVDGL